MYRDDKHARMVPTFDTEVACSAIDDLSIIKVNEEYVMVFICENLSGGTTMMFRSVMVEQIELGNIKSNTQFVLYSLNLCVHMILGNEPLFILKYLFLL